MKEKVSKVEAKLLVKRMQALYFLLNEKSKKRLAESFNQNSLRELIKVPNVEQFIAKHDMRSTRIFFETTEYGPTISVEDIKLTCRNCNYLLKRQLPQN